MTSQDVPRNTAQRAGNIQVIADRIIDADIGIYTVPVGKRTRLTNILGNVDALGGDATYSIARLRGAVFKSLTISKGIGIDQLVSAVTFEAGDILTDIGDSGSKNGTFDISATIEEFSV